MILLAPLVAAGVCLFLVKLSALSFSTIFMINIWLLSIPHSFATFLRSDLKSFGNYSKSFIVYSLFFILLVYASLKVGMVAIYSIYFYWQQFHYTKQNLGIARRIQKKTENALIDNVFYLSVTAIAIAGLFNEGNEVFFGYKLINLFPFHINVMTAALVNGLFLISYLIYRRSLDKMAIIHNIVFSSCYLLPHHFAEGWLYLNVFHNAQYLFFMRKIEAKFSFYLNALLVTLAFYLLFTLVNNLGMMLYSFPLTIFMLLSLNFSHYIFDGIIWKRKTI